MIFDFLDGKTARLLEANTTFGLYFDSLADFVSFGISPVVLVCVFFSKNFAGAGYFFNFMYMASGSTRLLRYSMKARASQKSYFSGLPIPAAAGVIVSFVLFAFYMQKSLPIVFIKLLLACLSVLMVSTIKYPVLEKINFNKGKIFIGLILLTSVFFSNLYLVTFLCFAIYVFTGIITQIINTIFPYRKLIYNAGP